jgi:tetratricopeptide (TPR) repeat protein
MGDLAGSVATYQQALPIADGLVHRDAANTEWRRFRGNMLSDYGFALVDKGDFHGALEQFMDARENHQELVTRDPQNASWQVDMSRILTRTGDAYLMLGDYASASDVLEKARSIRAALVARNPKNDVWKRLLAWSAVKLAQLYNQRRATGDMARALTAQEEALALRTELLAAAPSNAGLKNELASSYINLARVLMRDAGSQPARVAELIDKGVVLAQQLVDGDPINNEWKETLVQGLYARGIAANAVKDPATARAALEPAVTIAQDVIARSPENAYWGGTLAELLEAIAYAADADGKPDEALAHRKAAFAAIDAVVSAGKLPAYRKALYNRLRAYQ